MLRILWFIITAASSLFVAFLEGFIWLGHGLKQFILIGGDAWRARPTLLSGTYRCPAGHLIDTDTVSECQACGFRYQGSLWRCANPECQAITPFTNCPTCALSLRNPWRWGRP